jgi:hypothetical protein
VVRDVRRVHVAGMRPRARQARMSASSAGPIAPSVWPIAPFSPLWEVGVGVVALDLADYPGADERTNYVLPLPFFAYRGDVFKVDRDGVRGLFFKTDAVELDVSLNASVPVWEGVVFQPQLTLDLHRLTPLSGWRVGAAAGQCSVTPATMPTTTAWLLSTLRQRARPIPLPASTPAASLFCRPAGVFPPSGSEPARWTQLSGAVFEDSPLVKRQQALSFGFAVAWMFKRSATLVQADD